MSKFRWLALLAFMVAGGRPVCASTVLFRTDAQLVAQSERVVHGRVISQRTVRGGPEGRRIYTVTTLQIIEDLTGIDGASVEIWELGGTVGGETMYVGGGVEFRLGEEVVVCLDRGPMGLRTVGMGLSKFEVLPEVNGERQLRRDLRETMVLGGAVARDPLLSELRSLTAARTGRAPRPGRAPLAGELNVSAQQPFTTLGTPPFRWIQADTGQPVTWYLNSSAPSPLVSGDGAAELQTALSAWTSPPTASIVLQYGGTSLQTDADGPFTGVASAAGVVTFEDPNNEITYPTLAIGGGWAGGSGGTVNGTTFAAFTRGYVIFENAAMLTASFRQSLNFSRVLTHEIGHAIGLGHTQTDGSVANAQTNIMYPSCCSTSTPTPPAIGPDDLTGLNFIYPSGASPCSFSISPTSTSVAAAATSGAVSVTTQAGCAWTAVTNSAFVAVTAGSSGSGSGLVGYSVQSNSNQSTRSGTLTIAGRTFTVNQAAPPCSYTLSAASSTLAAAGGTGSLNVSAGSGCAWTAASNAAFANITAGASGSGNGSVSFSVTSNGANFRSAALTIAGQAFSIYQFGSGPFVTINRGALRYGATLSGATVTAQTSSQTVRLTQTSGAAVSWTATSNQPWLAVTPASGSGTSNLTITVNPAAAPSIGTATGAVSLTLTGAGNTAAPIAVTLATLTTGTSLAPSGVIDTPLNNATGVVGAIPVTGWALDDVEVANVFVCRYVVPGDVVAPDGRCGGASQIFLGEGVFIDDARGDVATAFPALPRNYRGGWGMMLLTNMLPGQGNGPYTLTAYARDREGMFSLLGQRAFTADNDHATRPFGAIDTPAQGGVATGASYVNFGWALTQTPKTIPTDGSTITVFIDGVAHGTVTYNNFRGDIAGLFPGRNNSNGAVGFRVIDTTALADGLHTIAWTVVDNAGLAEGIGSRYFQVSNGVGALTAATSASVATAASRSASSVSDTVLGRTGWDLTKSWRSLAPNSAGRVVVRAEEIGRVELQLGMSGATTEGHLRVGETLEPLPVGSRLDPETGIFTWQPGVGFVGSYDFVFTHRNASAIVARRDVRIVLHAKGSGFVGPQVVIDTPKWQADVAQPFVLGGWAADLAATSGTGIATLHAWAYPLSGGAPVFVGQATYGLTRTDVAAVHGDEFRDSGYGLTIQGLTPGNYDLAVFAWVESLADFAPAGVVRLTVR